MGTYTGAHFIRIHKLQFDAHKYVHQGSTVGQYVQGDMRVNYKTDDGMLRVVSDKCAWHCFLKLFLARMKKCCGN